MVDVNNKNKQEKASDFDRIKHPGKFLKSLSNRKIRREPVEDGPVRHDSKLDRLSPYKRPGHCPVCQEKLKVDGRSVSTKTACQHCKSYLRSRLRCRSCGTKRVWAGPNGARCRGCGNIFVLVNL